MEPLQPNYQQTLSIMNAFELQMEEARKNMEIRERISDDTAHKYVGAVRDGLLAVRDEMRSGSGNSPFSVWYHVDESNTPAYERRFDYADDFSGGVAVVKDSSGYYHIYPDGREVYPDRIFYMDRSRLRVLLEKAMEIA